MVDFDWRALCQALYKGIEGEDWGELFDAYKEMSRAVGKAQKAKALWAMKAAKDAGEEHFDPTGEDNILGRNKNKMCILGWTKPSSVCGNFMLEVSARLFGGRSVSRNGGRWLPLKFVGKADLGERLALLGSDGYEPKQVAEPQDHRHFTEDNQLAEHEDLCVKSLFFHRPSIASTCDSAESIVTPPPVSDLDDEQLRALLASPLYLQEREENAERSQVITLHEQT